MNFNNLKIQIPKYPVQHDANRKESKVDKWIDRYALGEVFEKDEFKRVLSYVKAHNLWHKFENAALTHTQRQSFSQQSASANSIVSPSPSQSSDRVRRSSRTWSISSMDDALRNLDLPQFTRGGSGITGHHKIARSKLRKLLRRLTETQKFSLLKVIEPMVNEISPISANPPEMDGESLTKEKADWLERAIQSLNFNVFPGPPPDQRIDDEGAKLDCHYFADGSLTPRSSALSKIERLITFESAKDLTANMQKHDSTKVFENTFTDLQFEELLNALKEAHEAHQAIVESNVMDTNIAHWLELPRNGTTSLWVRKPANPQHYPENLDRKGSAHWQAKNNQK